MTYNPDGTIPKLPFWSKTGPDQIESLNPYAQTEAETISWAWDVNTETCSEGGMDVTAIENGDFIKIKGVDFASGATSLDVRVASAGSGGNIEVRLDSQTGTLVGTCAVSSTGGAQTWVTKTCPISGASGKHDLFFVFTGGSGSLFNFNWWKFHGTGSLDGGQGTGGGTGADGATGVGGAGGEGAGGKGGAGTGGGGAGLGGAGGSGAGGKSSAQTGGGGAGPGGAGGSGVGGKGGAQTGGSAEGGTVAGAGGGVVGSGGTSPSGSSGAGGMGGASRGSGGVAGGVGGITGYGGSAGSTPNHGGASGCTCELGRSAGSRNGWLGSLLCLGMLAWCRRKRCHGI